VGFSPEEKADIRERWVGSRNGGTESKWAKVDELLTELGQRLELKEE
jgi:hypothetical protein